MIFGRVAGTVVSTERCDGIKGAKYLLVELCSHRAEGRDNYLVVLDTMGAGSGEMVIISQGSSARQTEISNKKPVDAIVAGIVDLIEEQGEIVYRK